MSTYALLNAQLGSLTIPLLGFALIAALIIIEGFIKLSLATFTSRFSRQAKALHNAHSNKPTEVRERVLQLYLQKQLTKLTGALRVLQLIAALAPITGLLGTVIGLITAFDAVAASTTGVNPALVADGLGIAMKTTAAGLVIALPSLFFASIYQLWAEKLIARITYILNTQALKEQGAVSESFAS